MKPSTEAPKPIISPPLKPRSPAMQARLDKLDKAIAAGMKQKVKKQPRFA